MVSRMMGDAVSAQDRMRTTPINAPRTNRPIMVRNLTSANAGLCIPVMAIPLLREDSVSGARFRFGFQMDETVEVLLNSVNVRVLTYLVPKLAFDRFNGLDSINRSYMGQPMVDGGAVIPWFEPFVVASDVANPILHYLGKHVKPGTTVNSDYIEAYNQIWNFRAKNRSPHLTLRQRLDTTLAPAFWNHQMFAHIVPDFDQAIIDGEVALNVVNSKMPVSGIGYNYGAMAAAATNVSVRESGTDATVVYPLTHTHDYTATPPAGAVNMQFRTRTGTGGQQFPDIWAELQDNGITVSLSNIEMARKTQAFANLRRQYNGHSDEFLIDLLMDGITIPDEAWKQPMLLSDVSTVFGMNKRWATDGASLTDSVVNGYTEIDVGFSCPKVTTGGVIMTIVEITPEQLFERQKDPYLHSTAVSQLPAFLRDTLDPEKVEVVTNDEVDVLHSSPTATFGYAPLNHNWAKSVAAVGGRYWRSDDDSGFQENRQRIWAVETANPVLGTDFYLCTNMHYKPFVVTDINQDHFECLIRGEYNIRGNTVFGNLLIEATDDYAKVMEKAPVDRIQKPATVENFERVNQLPAGE